MSDGDKGDITVTSSGTVWTVDNSAISYAKMQNVSAASKLLGRGAAAGAGTVEEISLGSGLSMTGTTLSASGGGGGAPTTAEYLVKTADATLTAERVVGDSTSVVANWATSGQVTFERAALTGDVTATANSNATTIANGAVNTAKLGGDITLAGKALLDDADAAAQRTTLGLGTLATQSGTFSGTSSGTNTGDQTITLTGNVTGSGTGSFAATIANDAVTYAKMQNVTAASRLLGRGSAAGSGDVEEISLGSGLSMSGTTLSATGGTGFTAKTTLGPARRRYLDGTTGPTTQDVFYQDVFNVKDYGAYGNGINDDTSPVNSTISAALAASNGGAVYFPAGEYRLNSLVSVAASKDITFIGDGDNSEIVMYSTSGCFNVTLSAAKMVEFINLRITSNASGVGIALAGPGGNFHSSTMLFMEGVTLARGSSYFTKGITMSAVYNGVINNCLFDGANNSDSAGNRPYTNTALEITSLSTNLLVCNTNFNFFSYGYYCAVYQEGINFTNCYWVDVNVGIYSKSNSGLRSTWLSVVASHIDSRGPTSCAAEIENASAVFINSSLFIAAGTNVLFFKRVFESSVVNSQIFGPASVGILLDQAFVAAYSSAAYGNWPGGNLPTQAVSIIGNNFRGPPVAIRAAATTVQVYAQGNTNNNNANGNFSNTFSTLVNEDLSGIDDNNNYIGDSISFTTVVTTNTLGSAVQDFSIDISRAALGKKPKGLAVSVTNDTSIGASYDWDDVDSSKSNAVIRLFKYDGSGLPITANYRLSIVVGP